MYVFTVSRECIKQYQFARPAASDDCSLYARGPWNKMVDRSLTDISQTGPTQAGTGLENWLRKPLLSGTIAALIDTHPASR